MNNNMMWWTCGWYDKLPKAA